MEKHREGSYNQPFNTAFLVKGKAKNPKVLIEFVGTYMCQTKKVIADSKAKVGILPYKYVSSDKNNPYT